MTYGSTYREQIVEKLRKAAEHCDCLQCFFLIHSMGGGKDTSKKDWKHISTRAKFVSDRFFIFCFYCCDIIHCCFLVFKFLIYNFLRATASAAWHGWTRCAWAHYGWSHLHKRTAVIVYEPQKSQSHTVSKSGCLWGHNWRQTIDKVNEVWVMFCL